MSLSRDYTAKKLWREAVRDLGSIGNLPRWERFNLMNRAVQSIGGQFYDLMKESYRSRVGVDPNASMAWLLPGNTLTYTAATRTILGTMEGNPENCESGIVMFLLEGAVYTAKVASAADDGLSFVIEGLTLPAAGGSITSLLAFVGYYSDDAVALGALRIMRTQQELDMRLESTATNSVEPLSFDDFNQFRPSASHNLNRIVWCFVGEALLLKKGDSVAYGTLTLTYPRVATLLADDVDAVDLPDGTPIEIAILKLRKLIADRVGKEIEDPQAKMRDLINAIYHSYGVQLRSEDVDNVIRALN